MSKRELAIQLLDEVPEYKLGYVLAFIQGLVIADTISSKTLEDMDQAIINFKRGSVSPAIDLSDVEKEGFKKEVVE